MGAAQSNERREEKAVTFWWGNTTTNPWKPFSNLACDATWWLGFALFPDFPQQWNTISSMLSRTSCFPTPMIQVKLDISFHSLTSFFLWNVLVSSLLATLDKGGMYISCLALVISWPNCLSITACNFLAHTSYISHHQKTKRKWTFLWLVLQVQRCWNAE